MSLNFDALILQVESIHFESQKYASQQINFSLTMRNILIGYYLVEYEQNGSDRAKYVNETIQSLAKRLKHLKGISKTQLYRFRDFYLTYPQIFTAVTKKLESTQLALKGKFPTASGISIAETMNELVEYTTTGLSNEIFVSKYMVELPSKEVLQAFIEKELKENNEMYEDDNR